VPGESLKIVTYPAKVLSRPGRRLSPGDIDLHDLFERMKVVMRDEEGIGLAAPQVGLSVRFAIAHDSRNARTLALVNPQITWASNEKKVGVEGCLSFPGVYGDIERSLRVRVKWKDIEWVEHEEEFEGHFARVLQHEIDHVNGVLMLDRAIDGLWEPAKPGEETEDSEEEEEDGETGSDESADEEDPYRGLVIDPQYDTRHEEEPVEAPSA
jgi:peptide deformylase